MDDNIEQLKSVLQARGLRPSFHRIKILEYLHSVQGHPAVEDIFSTLSPEVPSLSRATIYNTLNSFVGVGLVRVISINGVEKRYDLALGNHGHFQCERCGRIINFKIDIDHLLLDDLNQYEIHEKNVYFHGLCPDCLALEPEKNQVVRADRTAE